MSLTSGACRAHAIVKLRRTFTPISSTIRTIMTAAPPETAEGKPARRSFRALLWLGVFALLLFVPAGTVRWPGAWVFLGHHGGREFLGLRLARPPRPRAAQGAHAAALPAGAAAPGQAPDGHLPAALARLVRAHGSRSAARLVERAGVVADPRQRSCSVSASGSLGRC